MKNYVIRARKPHIAIQPPHPVPGMLRDHMQCQVIRLSAQDVAWGLLKPGVQPGVLVQPYSDSCNLLYKME